MKQKLVNQYPHFLCSSFLVTREKQEGVLQYINLVSHLITVDLLAWWCNCTS